MVVVWYRGLDCDHCYHFIQLLDLRLGGRKVLLFKSFSPSLSWAIVALYSIVGVLAGFLFFVYNRRRRGRCYYTYVK